MMALEPRCLYQAWMTLASQKAGRMLAWEAGSSEGLHAGESVPKSIAHSCKIHSSEV